MSLRRHCLTAAFVLFAVPAFAQGTPEQQAACQDDAMRLCSADVPDVGKITACLRRERVKVSARCQQVMRAGEQQTDVASTGSTKRRATP